MKLSEQGKQDILEALTKMREQAQDEVLQSEDAPISIEFVRKAFKANTLDEMVEKNAELTAVYTGLLNLYGFDNAYSMYVYALSRSTENELKKNIGIPITCKLNRNGREEEIIVYEESVVEKSDLGTSSGYIHARDLQLSMKDVESPNTIIKHMNRLGNSEQCDRYLTMSDGEVVLGIAGYNISKGAAELVHFNHEDHVEGVGARAFFELVKMALDKDIDAVVHTTDPRATTLLDQFGFVNKGEYWETTSKNLRKNVGEI